jgi:hypothetical protein
MRRGWTSDRARWEKVRDSFTVTILGLKLSYSDLISNSHDCPHNGITNWDRKKLLQDGSPAPQGYPGFSGRIQFQTSNDPVGFSSDIFKGTRIRTGGGGGGGRNIYTFGVSFFLDDWPAIAERINEQKAKHEHDGLIDMIKNQYQPYRVPEFKFGKIT